MAKNLKTILILFLILSLNISCVTCLKNETTANINERSFVHVSIVFTSNPQCEKDKNDPECTKDMYGISASGSVIYTDKNHTTAFVLTAKHVCLNEAVISAFQKEIPMLFKAKDFQGNEYFGVPMFLHKTQDVCIMKIATNNDYLVPVKIAETKPNFKDHMYSLAAPLSTFEKGMLPLFEGYYAGKLTIDDVDSDLYTIPSDSGSSGAPIFNSDGELVGMIHSVMSRFKQITLSVPWETLSKLNDFIKKNS